MFEKEAEEYGKTSTNSYKDGLVDIDDISVLDEAITESFKDGAEFGYNKAFVEADKNLKAVVADFNKANEWHYVKDGISPTHSYRVLVFTDEGVGFGIYGLDDKKWHTYDTGFEVIAWKEIVLPRLPKEE